MITITKQEVEALLGRSLTSIEDANFELYWEIATLRAEDILCTSLSNLLTVLGVETLPSDLKLAIARLFGGIGTQNAKQYGVESKHVEDFSISFNTDADIFAGIISDNSATFSKYAQCKSNIRHGRTLMQERYLYDCL